MYVCTYRYWRWVSWANSGPKVPEMLELPKSLKFNSIHRNKVLEEELTRNGWIWLVINLQANNVIVGVAGNMEPST